MTFSGGNDPQPGASVAIGPPAEQESAETRAARLRNEIDRAYHLAVAAASHTRKQGELLIAAAQEQQRKAEADHEAALYQARADGMGQ